MSPYSVSSIVVVLPEFQPLVFAVLEDVQHRLAGIVRIDDVLRSAGKRLDRLRLPTVVTVRVLALGIAERERPRTTLHDLRRYPTVVVILEVEIRIHRDLEIARRQWIAHFGIIRQSLVRSRIDDELQQMDRCRSRTGRR